MKNTIAPRLEQLLGARLLGGFQKFARAIVRTSGHPLAFAVALSAIVVWGLVGPFFGYGNTWLLVINTLTNIITFLMIFLIRSAQNRESEAVQIKLDELIRATKTARNALLDIEELSEEELDRIKGRFEQLARNAREETEVGRPDIIRPEAVMAASANPGPSGEGSQ
jgi:low affinity Fe/Cu permease